LVVNKGGLGPLFFRGRRFVKKSSTMSRFSSILDALSMGQQGFPDIAAGASYSDHTKGGIDRN